MNDTELDELLNTWRAPLPRAAMRDAVRAGVAQAGFEAKDARPPRTFFTRWRFAAAAAVVIFAVVLASPGVSPRRASLPFVVDSKVTYYVPGGPPWYAATLPDSPLVTSYNDAGTEVILAWSDPDRLFQSVLWKIRLAVSDKYDWIKGRGLSLVEHLDPRVHTYEDDKGEFAVVYPSTVASSFVVGRRDRLLSSGCRTSHRGWTVVGEDVILNYPTVILQEEHAAGNGLLTIWMAPELSCFALRATIQQKQPDGKWKLLSEKKAVKVTVK